MRRSRRAAGLALGALIVLLSAAPARADFLVTPFVGVTFGAETGFLILDETAIASKDLMFGGSWGWVSDQVFGAEGEVAFAPGFFKAEDPEGLVTANSVSTLFGNVIAALPVSISQEGLRPYLVGGLGVVRIRLDDLLGLASVPDNSLALQLGAGALGFVNERAGLRFDLRHIRSLARTTHPITLERSSKLSFWRASVGVAIRY
jgi:hypothetical protein